MSRNKKASPGDPTRICYVCKVEKPVDEFIKLATGVDGVGTLCKPCKRVKSAAWRSENPDHNQEWRAQNKLSRQEYERERTLRRHYNMSLNDYSDMLTSQGGVCAICGLPPTNGQGKILHVDHDHATGKIRGLLCHGCNTSLGHFQDNVAFLQKAITYLEEA